MIRTRSLIGLALASTVLLTGCNASGWNPGVAVRVDDETISLAHVQDTTTSYCSAVETQLEEGRAITNSVVGAQVAGSLALRVAAEQWAASVGVEPGEDYDAAVQQLDQELDRLSELTDEQREAIRDVNLAQPYLDSVELAYGEEQTDAADAGADDAAAADAARQAGQEAFADWLDGQDVRIDPRYSVTLADGGISRADTQLSVPVSDLAKSTSSGEADADYATGLADQQRCGG